MVWPMRPTVGMNQTWRAVATTLASIIGRGFLVCVPILCDLVGACAAILVLGTPAEIN